jgi:transglycosylase-like protein with SLT domain
MTEREANSQLAQSGFSASDHAGSAEVRLRDRSESGDRTPAVGEIRAPDAGREVEAALMARLHQSLGEAFERATAGTLLPSAFLAALVANESGGRAHASRFEQAVFGALQKVRQGRRPRYGGFIREQLQDKTPGELRALATSWGLTQIMGFNAAARGIAVGFTGESLLDPESHLALAVQMLSEFAARFKLDLARDFAALFNTWNTGSPDGRTFDPDYVPRGLRRLELYRELALQLTGGTGESSA